MGNCRPWRAFANGGFHDEGNPVRVIDVFVDALDLAEMSFGTSFGISSVWQIAESDRIRRE